MGDAAAITTHSPVAVNGTGLFTGRAAGDTGAVLVLEVADR
jgi:hypothetical protein